MPDTPEGDAYGPGSKLRIFTPSREELRAIRKRAAFTYNQPGWIGDAPNDVIALLAHLDALIAAVENARVEGAAYAEEDNWGGGVEAMRKVAADILRGEQ